MIDYLIGVPELSASGTVVMNIGNVGFALTCSKSTAADIGGGGEVKLYTYMNVTENAISLFGFSTPLEREIFLALLTVPKIGAKSAVSILSVAPPDRIVGYIINKDVKALSAANGIGKKTAEAIIVELKDKFAKLSLSVGAQSESATSDMLDEYSDVVLALQSLGYEAGESVRAANSVYEEGLSTQELIARALLKIGLM